LWEEDKTMTGKTKPPYPPEYRRRTVELLRSGRSIGQLCREFGLAEKTVRKWRNEADRDEGVSSDGMKTDEKTEVARLRREVATLREERDILKKAAAWFAQEAVPTPKGRSGS
jgi:transposase-like protein